MTVVRVLLVVLVLAAAGCGRTDERDRPAGADSVPPTAPRRLSPAAPRRLSPAVRYTVAAGELNGDLKQVAADAVQAFTTYQAAADPSIEVSSKLASMGLPGVPAPAASVLLVADTASEGDVIYPELAGLTDDAAAVMVVLRQRLEPRSGRARTVTRTVEVTLGRDRAGWRLTGLESAGGVPPRNTPPLSVAARRVLRSERADLPDSVRWDIEAGQVDERVLAVVADLAEQHDIAVTVLATGHPYNVFGTERVSNHTRGRAVDIWAIDGRPIVQQRDPQGPVADVARMLLARGVTELGGPWDLDGAGTSSFTDAVHQDHLHIGFDQ